MQLSKVFRNPFFRAATGLSLLAGAGLGLNACQSLEGDDRNSLAVGLAIPPAKFADAIIGSGYAMPMSMAFSPDGKLFILEKGGKIRIHGVTDPFLTLTVDQWEERGLSSMAFDPQWSTQKYVYVYFSASGQNRNRVSRFTVDPANPNKALAGSEVVLFDLSPLVSSGYHNGGGLAFGKDGYLYLATGDNRLPANGQDKTNTLGKLLRFSKEPGTTAGNPKIPSDNPFISSTTGNNQAIWAMGLRNPYTMAVQPGTGRVFVNDIGEKTYEELNDATQKGLNFGWPNSEGPTTAAGHMSPVGGYVNGFTAYGDYNRGDCAIIGAAFYNPPAGAQKFPGEYLGNYFYGDHCSRYIKRVDPAAPATPTLFATDVAAVNDQLMDIDVGPDGALYYLTKGGQVGRITYTGTEAPTISSAPASQLVSVGKQATFSVIANGPDLKYEWFRNDAATPIAGAASNTYSFTAALADNGAKFKVRVFNGSGTVTSANAILSVTTNQAPVPVIATPTGDYLWSGGTTVNFSGSANDPENGALPGTSLAWKVELTHGTHTHPAGAFTGTSGSFAIPTVTETAPDVGYRLTLTATDAQGMSASVTRDIKPKTVILTVLSNPSGMAFKLDDQPQTAPFQFTSVVGVQRSLEAVSQTFNGQAYAFGSWSNGQPAKHNLATPATAATYTVNYTSPSIVTAVPGRLEAENFKTGGEGAGYHDLTANNEGGNVHRGGEGVDIEATTDAGGGYNVGWTAAGEWIDYAINVGAAGNYNFVMRVASGAAGTKTAVVKVGGQVKGTFSFTANAGWQGWSDVAVNGVVLSAGQQVLRVEMTTGNMNFNYLQINSAGGGNQPPSANAGPDKSAAVGTLVTLNGSGSDPENAPLTYSWTKISGPAATLSNSAAAQPTFTPSSAGTYVFRLTVSDGALSASDEASVTATGGTVYINLPGRIQAEDYQPGGQGVGYNDLTAGNTGGVYKTDGVDIQATTDPTGGAYNVGWTDAGEWLDYDVNVASAGAYTLTARVASGNAGTKTLGFSVDGGAETLISFTHATGWQTWNNVAVTGVNLPAGTHWVRLRMATGGINLNYLDVAAEGSSNLLLNGDFANGIVSWNTYWNAPATGTIANEAGSARATITNAGVNEYDIQIWQGVNLVAGKTYTIDFDIKAEATPKNFKVVVENNGNWTKYQDRPLTVTAPANAWQHFSWTWTQGVADPAGRLVFDFGAQNLNDVWIDNVVLK